MTPNALLGTMADLAYDEAVRAAGPNPNMLGFLRRAWGSSHYRQPPAGREEAPASDHEVRNAIEACRLAARVGRW